VRGLLLRTAASPLFPINLRWALLRACGLDLATRRISAGTLFTGPRVSVGRGTFINTGCVFDAWAPITIGERCAFGPGVMVLTSTHAPGDHTQRAGAMEVRPVTIGDGCWIGARVTILPGVTIAPGCVIAAGAVVTRDCEPDRLYGGVPAAELKRL
jgi:maltose O-acetyltransferase